MNIFYCNLNRFNEEIEEFVIAKNKIESSLKLKGQLQNKMTVNEFMNYVNDFKNTLINLSDIIAFNIYELINGDKVIIFSSKNKDNENLFKSLLEKIKYNFNNCKKLSYAELLQNSLNTNYFSIDNEIYIP